jgi:hypothetical protein
MRRAEQSNPAMLPASRFTALHRRKELSDLFSLFKMVQLHFHNPPVRNFHKQFRIVIFISKKSIKRKPNIASLEAIFESQILMIFSFIPCARHLLYSFHVQDKSRKQNLLTATGSVMIF